MANAKEELLDHVRNRVIKCVALRTGLEWLEQEQKKYQLPVGFYPEELDQFLKSIDFNYDSGYGGQELFGTIWYEDGTWSERGEYDGSEWWDYKSVPDIPLELQRPTES